MIATKLFIKWFGGVFVVVSVVGGVAYEINNDIQVQKKEENIKKISSKTIELDKLIEKLKQLKERLKVVEQNILYKEKEISDLEEKNLELKISEKTLNTEIESLTVAIEELNQKIQEKSALNNQKQIEELNYQESVNSWATKIFQKNLNKQLKDIALKKAAREFNAKKTDLTKATNEKNDAQQKEQNALSKKASDANVVSGLKVLLAEHSRQKIAALKTYEDKKTKVCVLSTASRVNARSTICKNSQRKIINKSESITQTRLNRLLSDSEEKKRVFEATKESLKDKEAVYILSQENWNEKTRLLNEKIGILNQKTQIFADYKKKKTDIEREIKQIDSAISEDKSKLNLEQKSLEAAKTDKKQAQKDLSDAFEKKQTEEENKQKAQSNLSTNTLALKEVEKKVLAFKETLSTLNTQKWKLEDEISAKEILKASLEEKIESLKPKNT